MSDIELVIKIPEEEYIFVKKQIADGITNPLKICIANGTPLQQRTGHWIPVSEKLPEIHNYMQEYIVTIKGNFIRTAFFTETNGKSWWSIDNVTAWMPLPKPYEQQESEDKE